jgi:hypothetical protein
MSLLILDIFYVILLLAIVPGIAAQNELKVHVVSVGKRGSRVFDPETIIAKIGEVVMFEFFPTNHSVVRGEYVDSSVCGSQGCNPCVPYEMIYPSQPQQEQGFNSGNIMTQSTLVSNNVSLRELRMLIQYRLRICSTSLCKELHLYGSIVQLRIPAIRMGWWV